MELVDITDLKSVAIRRAGSSPAVGTINTHCAQQCSTVGGHKPKIGESMARKAKAAEPAAETRTETVEEYLARGGKITTIPYGQRSEDVMYKTGPKSRGRKKKTEAAKD